MTEQNELWKLTVRDGETTKIFLAERADGGMSMTITALRVHLYPAPTRASFEDATSDGAQPLITSDADEAEAMDATKYVEARREETKRERKRNGKGSSR